MKVTYSTIVADARGSAGPVTFSKWKGIPTVRSRVTPANPNTVAQQAQRALMTLVTGWWSMLAAGIKTFINTLASGKPYSGFNRFSSVNLRQLATPADPTIIPTDAELGAPASASAAAGGNAGELAVSWVAGEAAATDKVEIYGGVIANPGDQPAEIAALSHDAVAISAGTATIAALTAGARYCVFVGAYHAADGTYSIMRRAEGLAHA